MATSTKTAKAVITSTTQDNLVVLPSKLQAQVKTLREARNIAKQAKAQGDTARNAILDFVGETTVELTGVDAKGKRLINIKVIPSSESFDWTRLELENPELFVALKKEYTIPKGAGTPTLRVDTI